VKVDDWYPGDEKPRTSRCFSRGDLIVFVKEKEVAILTERLAPCGVNSSGAWRMHFSPGKNTPNGYSVDYGYSAVNLYNCMGPRIKWVPK
jgi:hypothetical protein